MLPSTKRVALLLALAVPATLPAADYTYQQTTQLTGGSLLHMMKSVGFISSQARHMGDPIVSSIYLKDNRLANVSPETIEIIDLDKETITNIDVQKKTYTVMTFDQIKQAMENAHQQIQKQQAAQPAPEPAKPDAQNVKMSFDVKVRKTGAQKEISGLQSNEAILTMTMTATDTQTQQSGNMAITNDMWMVPEIPGYDQVRDFYKRMAMKMVDAGTIGLGYDFSKMLAQNPGAGQALGDMAKEMQKLDGVPIMQVMRMGTTTNGQPLPAASEAPTPAEPAGPSAGDVAKQGMTSALTSHFGFGGFGKKKQDPPPDQNQNGAQAQPTSAILMETQITTSNFSSAPVDSSHFDVPAGYKLVQPPAQTTVKNAQ
ncbi:MAG: hypothetical protein WA354_08400 [Terracidiphilus sp.]